MMLIVGGLLLGMVGLVWVMVINLMRADHQTKRHGLWEPIEPVTEAARRESETA